MKADDYLQSLSLPTPSVPTASTKRFEDGAHLRVEIASVENPSIFQAALEEADHRGVTVNRVSQGSGAMLLTDAELREMAHIGADRGVEVSMFIGPREGWDIGAQARGTDGPAIAGQLRGMRQLRYAVEDVLRSVEAGIRGFLIPDAGLLELLVRMQHDGALPKNIVWKISAMLSPSNPVALGQLERLGASTVNLPSDLPIELLAEFRAATDLPLDVYVESPDSMGGVVRGYETADLVAVGAPFYAKFGLRNTPAVYPVGLQNADVATRAVREKVRRSEIALEWMRRVNPDLVQSRAGAEGLGIPTI